jgi:hypothetical protein
MQISNKPTGFSNPGFHVARCCGIIQLGTIFLYGHWKPMLRIEWELPRELRPFKAGEPEQPKIISREYSASLYGESHLKKHLISWFGFEFVNIFATNLDITMILGAPCLLNISHKTDQNGRWFEMVEEVHGARPEDNVPEAINQPRVLQLTEEHFDQRLYEKLPAFLKDKIAGSQEFKKLHNIA